MPLPQGQTEKEAERQDAHYGTLTAYGRPEAVASGDASPNGEGLAVIDRNKHNVCEVPATIIASQSTQPYHSNYSGGKTNGSQFERLSRGLTLNEPTVKFLRGLLPATDPSTANGPAGGI